MRKAIQTLFAWRTFIRNQRTSTGQQQLKRIFAVFRAAGTRRYDRTRDRLLRNPKFRLLLRKRGLTEALENWQQFESYEAGTFGRAIYEFQSSEEIDYAGLVTDFEKIGFAANTELDRLYAERERDMHDAIHILFGYNRTRFGEGATLLTQYLAGGAAGYGVLYFLGIIRLCIKKPSWIKPMYKGTRAVYQRQKGVPFREFPIENYLDEPLDTLRSVLGISEVPHEIEVCQRNKGWGLTYDT